MGKDETSEPLSKKKGDKIMRKKIAALLAMLMLGGVLTGCGGGNKVATGAEDPNVVPEDTYEIKLVYARYATGGCCFRRGCC